MQGFSDKCVFVFYAEIQDGHQKWQKDHLLGEKMPNESADTLGVKNFAESTISHHF